MFDINVKDWKFWVATVVSLVSGFIFGIWTVEMVLRPLILGG